MEYKLKRYNYPRFTNDKKTVKKLSKNCQSIKFDKSKFEFDLFFLVSVIF